MRNSPGIEHRQTAAWPSRLALEQEPLLVQRVASPEMMMALVAAGPALGATPVAVRVVLADGAVVEGTDRVAPEVAGEVFDRTGRVARIEVDLTAG